MTGIEPSFPPTFCPFTATDAEVAQLVRELWPEARNRFAAYEAWIDDQIAADAAREAAEDANCETAPF